jgi:hypothetical protein
VNVAEKFDNCTKEDQRSAIRFFLGGGGQKVYQVDKFVLSMGSVLSLSRRVVYEWIEMFKNDRIGVTDALVMSPRWGSTPRQTDCQSQCDSDSDSD